MMVPPTDVRTDVDIHRRHAGHSSADDSSRRESRIRRARCEPLHAHRIALPGSRSCRTMADVGDRWTSPRSAPRSEPEQDSFLHPGVDAPAGRSCDASGSAARIFPSLRPRLSSVERGASVRSRTRARGRRQIFSIICPAATQPRRPPALQVSLIRPRFCGSGGTSGSRQTGFQQPQEARAAFTGPGFDLDEENIDQPRSQRR